MKNHYLLQRCCFKLSVASFFLFVVVVVVVFSDARLERLRSVRFSNACSCHFQNWAYRSSTPSCMRWRRLRPAWNTSASWCSTAVVRTSFVFLSVMYMCECVWPRVGVMYGSTWEYGLRTSCRMLRLTLWINEVCFDHGYHLLFSVGIRMNSYHWERELKREWWVCVWGGGGDWGREGERKRERISVDFVWLFSHWHGCHSA